MGQDRPEYAHCQLLAEDGQQVQCLSRQLLFNS